MFENKRIKIVLCLLIFVFFILISSSSVFASTFITVDDNTIEIPDYITEKYSHYFVAKRKETKDGYAFFVGNSPFVFTTEGDKLYLNTTNFSAIGFSEFDKINFAHFDTLSDISKYEIDKFMKFDSMEIKYSNADIVKDNEKVFPEAPLGTIATEITSVDFSMVLQEVLGLLPMILVILIGLIALMKAIKLLYSIFQNA
ncbi:MAG: hypothetical protein HFJ17_02250 [Clostridia bacterium]|nr:hypothetical protein [Clostridia bacterium]